MAETFTGSFIEIGGLTVVDHNATHVLFRMSRGISVFEVLLTTDEAKAVKNFLKDITG